MAWQFLFWVCALVVGYVYAGYPLLLAILSRARGKRWRRAPFTGSVTIVLVARNEEANVKRRLTELAALLQSSSCTGEILIVSDGSTDRTAPLARASAAKGLVRVLELPQRQGKAAALTAGCAACRTDILVFADARQHWADDALLRLLENFADPRIGAVSGDLVLESAPGLWPASAFIGALKSGCAAKRADCTRRWA
jgi:glycosyltransferase involved in cell wall biosynthesis